MPRMRRLILAQIEEDLAEEPAVKSAIDLKLHFDKDQWQVWLFRRWRQHAIQSKCGLFDFFGTELVVLHARLFLHQLRGLLKEFVKRLSVFIISNALLAILRVSMLISKFRVLLFI